MKSENKRLFKNIIEVLMKDKLAVAGLVIVLVFLILGAFASQIAPHDPIEVVLSRKLQLPSLEFPMGTDNMGRCIFSRILYGTRVSLYNALVVLAAILAVGIPLGITAGYVGGWVDNLIMRLSDIASTFPSSLLALAIVGIAGPSMKNIMIVFIFLWWAPFARIIRGTVIKIKEKDFVTAAVSCGSSRFKIIINHIFLNSVSPIIVLSTLRVAAIIMHLAAFSFIGLGTQPPQADWGVMLNDGRQFITTNPILMLWPGLAIMFSVFGLNMLGEGFNSALLPISGEGNSQKGVKYE
ncbi:ABC transporter permease [Anaerovorax odorimutans]|uniref:ABC transporter permease n=1 Tax=Anaerovorax odorimutans TaxID=109327 RepID=UPI0004117AB8|nr:ABC transporter permease subunit [Anaerovorax odorimutans]